MKKQHIKIATPCTENWEKMHPHERGKFCQICSKPVQDFTHYSMQEIAETIAASRKNSTPICGKFTHQQLATPLPELGMKKKLESFSYKKIAASVALATSLLTQQNNELHAQVRNTNTFETSPTTSKNKPSEPLKKENSNFNFRGKIIYTSEKDTIGSFIVAFVSGDKKFSVSTNKNGSFVLTIPSQLVKAKNNKITINSIEDFDKSILPKDFMLTRKQMNKPFDVAIHSMSTMGMVVSDALDSSFFKLPPLPPHLR